MASNGGITFRLQAMRLAAAIAELETLGRMYSLMFICLFAGFALLIAWSVNAVIAWMSGEHPGDTGRQFGDIFFRVLGVGPPGPGFLGRLLNAVAGPWRWILYIAGGLLLASALLRACSER